MATARATRHLPPGAPSLRAAVARLFMAGIPGPALDDEPAACTPTPLSGASCSSATMPRHLRRCARSRVRSTLSTRRCRRWWRSTTRADACTDSAAFTHFPPAATVAAHGVGAVRAVATATARELAAIDVDLTFAPVLDVASNPANPVIGDRAFGPRAQHGDDARTRGFPRHARKRPSRMRQALPRPRRHRHGLAPRATGHRQEPACARCAGAGALSARDRRPHPHADDGARALPHRRPRRAGDAVAPDPDRAPAAHARFPRRHLQRRPRDAGDRRCWTPADAAVASLAAGADLLLFCHRQDALRAAVDAVEHAVIEGRLPAHRIAEAYRRVVALARWRARRRRILPLAVIGCRAHARLDASLRG